VADGEVGTGAGVVVAWGAQAVITIVIAINTPNTIIKRLRDMVFLLQT
jgi:hypothetical protein